MLAEIDACIGEFEAASAKDGPRPMAETAHLGRSYQFHETLATLHGCPDLPTMGLPLPINVVRFTRAYLASSSPPSAVASHVTQIDVSAPLPDRVDSQDLRAAEASVRQSDCISKSFACQAVEHTPAAG